MRAIYNTWENLTETIKDRVRSLIGDTFNQRAVCDLRDKTVIVRFQDNAGEIVAVSCILILSQKECPHHSHYQINDAILYNVVVSPSCRGEGIGTILLDRTMELCGELNLERVWLCVDPHNYVAKRLYLSKGWQVYGHCHNGEIEMVRSFPTAKPSI